MNYTDDLSFDSLKSLRKNNFAWKMLSSTNAPFVLSFLNDAFVENKSREISENELIGKLEVFLEINDVGEVRTAKEYLNDWSSESHSLLRKYYPDGKDESYFDLTPSARKGIDWIIALKPQEFIGTESRLISVFGLLNDIMVKTDDNPQTRIADLEEKKREIELEIEQIKQGKIQTLSDVQIKERFIQAVKMSNEIVSDFREVEQNFRNLEIEIREKIVLWQKGKGELIGDIFEQEKYIENSEQGKSFEAFYRFLLSKTQKDSFYNMLKEITALKAVSEIDNYKQIFEIEDEWTQGADKVEKVQASITKQIKRYLSDNYLSEERRISQIIKNIEKLAISVKDNAPKDDFMYVDGIVCEVSIPMERKLFAVPEKIEIIDEEIKDGEFSASDDSLFNQVYVDKAKLSDYIEKELEEKDSVKLSEVVEKNGIEHGLMELMTYLQIAEKRKSTKICQENTGIFYLTQDEKIKKISFPQIIFSKEE
ncbi:MAG: DUF3375 domain-containing protein [Clostridia bacterium]